MNRNGQRCPPSQVAFDVRGQIPSVPFGSSYYFAPRARGGVSLGVLPDPDLTPGTTTRGALRMPDVFQRANTLFTCVSTRRLPLLEVPTLRRAERFTSNDNSPCLTAAAGAKRVL